MEGSHRLKVAAVRRETPAAVHVRLEGGPPSLYDAYPLPGMTVAIALGGGDGRVVRVPLASQPERRFFEVLVPVESPEGKVLAVEGAEVEVGPPGGEGFPVFDYRRTDVYLVAYGTGIGPMRAAIAHILTERGAFDRVRLLYEARFLNDFAYREELPSWQRGQVQVYQVIARPDVGKWRRGEQAYVDDLLQDLAPDPARTVAFACGPEDFLMGVKGALRTACLAPDRVYVHEHVPSPGEIERARPAPRKPEDLARISTEGWTGSGPIRKKDLPDHPPIERAET